MDRIAVVADDEGGRGDLAAQRLVRRRATEEQAVQDSRAGPRLLADGVQADVGQQRADAAGDHPRAARDEAHDGLAEGQGDHQRREGDRAGQQRVVEHGHLEHHAADALRRAHRGLEARVGAQRGPAEHRLVELEVVEQRDHLLSEEGHRVAGHVLRAVRAPVTEQVQGHHPVAARGQGAGQRTVHLLREQQPVDQHERARTVSVDRVGQPAAFVAEEGHCGCAG